MIDAAADKDLAAFERAQARREAKAAYIERKKRKEQARLEASRPAASAQTIGELHVEETPKATVVVPVRSTHFEEEALSYLRIARISTACAAFLFIFLIWLWSQRRNS